MRLYRYIVVFLYIWHFLGYKVTKCSECRNDGGFERNFFLEVKSYNRLQKLQFFLKSLQSCLFLGLLRIFICNLKKVTKKYYINFICFLSFFLLFFPSRAPEIKKGAQAATIQKHSKELMAFW